MAKDYKEKLKDHLARLPAMPGAIVSGSPAYPTPYTAEMKKKILAPEFKVTNNKDFTDYTGITHLGLLQNWAGGGQLTSCNSFLAGCCAAMGARNLGAFELEKLLRSLGKSHAWVPAFSGEKPGYGDIFTASGRLHMGISLGFEDGQWLTAEGGQGGPITGFDVVKRKKGTFSPGSWEGWCDMRVFLDPRGAVPDWLPGWWVVYHGDETFHYHFNRYYEVTYTPYRPGDKSSGPSTPVDNGAFTLGSGDNVTVTWLKEGGTETFTYDRWNSFPGIMERMTGKSAKGEELKGVRL